MWCGLVSVMFMVCGDKLNIVIMLFCVLVCRKLSICLGVLLVRGFIMVLFVLF